MRGEQLYESAQRHLIGGAGAGGRVHPLLKRPLYLARGKGSRFWDVDGKEYLDPHIAGLADRLYRGIAEALRVTGVPGTVQGIGARFGLYLGVTEPVTDYRQAVRTNREMEVTFILGCVRRGRYIHDYGHTMHHGFSSQHTDGDIDQALGIIEDSLRDI